MRINGTTAKIQPLGLLFQTCPFAWQDDCDYLKHFCGSHQIVGEGEDIIILIDKMLSSMRLLVTLAPFAAGQQNQDEPTPSGPTTNQDRFVDYEYCYEALKRHDSDFSKRITKSEFLGFCQDFGGNTECLANLSELPIELQAVWNQITCECVNRGGAGDCCVGSNAHISISGVLPSDTTTISQQQFLRQACLRTDQAIVAYCGPPPIPPVIGPPGGTVLPSPNAALMAPQDIIILISIAAALLLVLCCCCRRRWFFCPDRKQEVDSDEERDEDPEEAIPDDPIKQSEHPDESGGMNNVSTEMHRSRFTGSKEENQKSGIAYGRVIQDPDSDDEEKQKKFVYEQYELPEKPTESINLRPVHRPPPPEEEDESFIVKHYTPDGGIVAYEKNFNFAYNADGGVAPKFRSKKEKVEENRPEYTRKEKEQPQEIDNRLQRILLGYDGSDIFRELDKIPDSHVSRFVGNPDWVILASLDTLDENAQYLEGSSEDDWDIMNV